MVLKLDPRIPLVWRDPFSLQFGVAAPVAVLRDVSPAVERMIASLASGISRSGLSMIGRAAGATDAEVESLLDRIAPALLSDVTQPASTVLVVGTGSTADAIAADLAATGHRVLVARDAATAAAQACDFAVIVAHYVIAPELHGLWLRRDLPHLPVVISDSETVVGPVIEPGVGPCLYCLQRYRTQTDASWPAIATQLANRRAASESPLLASEAAALATRIVARRVLEAGPSLAAISRTLSFATGEITELTWLPHPECGCIALDASGGGRSESDSPDAAPRGEATRQPTTGPASSALA